MWSRWQRGWRKERFWRRRGWSVWGSQVDDKEEEEKNDSEEEEDEAAEVDDKKDEENTHSNKEGGEKIGLIEPPTYNQTAGPREESLMGELYPKEFFEHKKNGQKQLTGRKPIRFRWLLRN